MKLILRLAWREIRSQPKFTLFFVLNIAFGMLGFFSLLLLKQSMEEAIETQSRAMLSADISVSGRRAITEEEEKKFVTVIEKLDQGYEPQRRTDIVEMFSMLASDSEKQKKSLLVQVKSIQEGFPLFGSVQLEKFGLLSSGKRPAHLGTYPPMWVYPEILPQLGLKLNELVRLGEQTFQVSDLVQKDIGTAFRLLSLAPKVYIQSQDLERTGLIRFGTTSTSTLFYILKSAPAELVENELQKVLLDPGLDVRSHKTASEQMNRLISYLSDYLALAAVVGLCLSSLGTGFLFRNYINKRFKDIGIFISLGLSRSKSALVFVAVAFLLSLAALLLSTIFSITVSPFLLNLVKAFTPFDLHFSFAFENVFFFFLFCFVTVALSCAPVILKIQDLKPSGLFREHEYATMSHSLKPWLVFPIALAVLWAVAIWQTQSPRVGSIFVASFLGSFLLIYFFARCLFYLIARLPQPHNIQWKIAFRNIVRMGPGVLESFLCLSLGCLLMNLIPQLQTSIRSEITQPESLSLPSFFLFDIQPEQVEPLQQLAKKHQFQLEALSPLVRARLAAINNQTFQKSEENETGQSREEQRNNNFRNRGYNLTYRESLNSSEVIIAGRPFSTQKEKEAEISVEKDFASRLNLKLGDKLSFDIQGVPIEGKIVNLRRVKWNSFQPNFFVVFQSGVLEEAPKTFLASIPSLPRVQRGVLQSELVSQFSNVSIIDVERAIQQILELTEQMSWALFFMAGLCILSGLVVLYSVANLQAYNRRWDYTMLKILGSKLSDLRKSVLVEYGGMAFLAALIGASISLLMSYVLSIYIFDGSFEWNTWSFVLSIAAVIVLSLLVVWIATYVYLKEKPGRYLFNRDL